MPRLSKFNPKKLSRRNALVLGAAVVLIVVGVALIFMNRPNKGSGIIPSKNTAAGAKTAATTDIAARSTAAGSTNAGAKYSAPPATTGSPPADPSGTFVSNHRPSLSGAAQQQSEQSVCNTSPGANCYITFTKGSIVKTLAAQTTDASGATYWSWNINDSGFSAGTWTVKALASLNGQTSTASDPIDLVIQP